MRWLGTTAYLFSCAVLLAAEEWGWSSVRDWSFGPTGAAWVQAIGSIGAILGAFAVAQQQSRNSVRAARLEAAEKRLEAAGTLDFLAASSVRALDHVHGQLGTREHIEVRAHQGMPDLLLTLENLRDGFRQIPLYGLPVDLLRSFNVIAGCVDQYVWKLKGVIEWHRAMDAAAFANYFQVFEDIRRVVGEERDAIAQVRARALEEVSSLR